MAAQIKKTISLEKLFDSIIIISLLLFSFFLNFKSGERGFYAFDQSLIFDGSYRILLGQVPYKDFLLPFGPMAFWLQALFFKIFGVNYFSYIFSASFVNILATACSIIILRLLFTGKKIISYIAGLSTAILFYPCIGTANTEQTSFFFCILSITLLLLVLTKDSSSPSRIAFLLLSGCSLFLSFISKQNAFVVVCPLFFLLIFIADIKTPRRFYDNFILFFAGFTLSLIVFFLWVLLKSDIGLFFKYFFDLPLHVGKQRILNNLNFQYLGLGCFLDFSLTPVVLSMGVSFLISLIMLIFFILNLNKAPQDYKHNMLASALCLYLIFFQILFYVTALNQVEEMIPFTGIIFAIAVGLFFKAMDISLKATPPLILKVLSYAVICIILSYLSIQGISAALSRSAQDLFSGSSFPRYLNIKGMESLRWGYPTKINNVDVNENDLIYLYRYLKQENKSFFIFPDFTFFYALLKVTPPQPLLWFHKGLTYPDSYDLSLDKNIVAALKKNKIEIIILEKESFFGTFERLKDFPRLMSYIFDNFVKTIEFGIFSVYQKKED